LIGLYLLDVSGHGVPSALLSVTLSNVLTTRDPKASVLFTQDADSDSPAVRAPREVAHSLNQQFPMSVQRGKYFTMAYALLDVETRILRYVIAGHPPPILVRQGCDPQELSGGSLPIGISDDTEFEDYSLQLELGDRIYFYSDGITEAVNSQNKMLQAEGFVRLIERKRSDSLKQSVESCVKELNHWCAPVPFADDLSLLGLEMPSES
jgi:sigma-B regulation protein RsbU (phosphoserine phosphatase)